MRLSNFVECDTNNPGTPLQQQMWCTKLGRWTLMHAPGRHPYFRLLCRLWIFNGLRLSCGLLWFGLWFCRWRRRTPHEMLNDTISQQDGPQPLGTALRETSPDHWPERSRSIPCTRILVMELCRFDVVYYGVELGSGYSYDKIPPVRRRVPNTASLYFIAGLNLLEDKGNIKIMYCLLFGTISLSVVSFALINPSSERFQTHFQIRYRYSKKDNFFETGRIRF